MSISDWSSDVCSSDLDSDPVPVDFVQQQERMVGDGPLPDPRSHDRRAELGMLNQKTGGRKSGFQHFDARAHAFGVKNIGSPKKFFASGVRPLQPHHAALRPAIRASISDRKSTRLN